MTNRGVVSYRRRPPPTFLSQRNTDETFQECGKQDSFRKILKSVGEFSQYV